MNNGAVKFGTSRGFADWAVPEISDLDQDETRQEDYLLGLGPRRVHGIGPSQLSNGTSQERHANPRDDLPFLVADGFGGGADWNQAGNHRRFPTSLIALRPPATTPTARLKTQAKCKKKKMDQSRCSPRRIFSYFLAFEEPVRGALHGPLEWEKKRVNRSSHGAAWSVCVKHA